MKLLRDYQQAAIDSVYAALAKGHRRIILTMPTGSGKTVTAGAMIHGQALRGKLSVFIVDRTTLVDQAVRHLESIGLRVGVLQGKNSCRSVDDEVIVATIQTIRARSAPEGDFFIIDEANNLHREHTELMQRWNNLPFIGLTATPTREDLGKHFETLIRGADIQTLMKTIDPETGQPYLVTAKAFCPGAEAMNRILENISTTGGEYINSQLSHAVRQKELYGDIVRTWKEKASDRKTLCFAVDVAHSKAIIEEFRSEGIDAAHLDFKTSRSERFRIIQGFKRSEIQVLSSVNVLAIGFDVPDASCAILARPTLSEALDMQQKGRILRPAEGKADALILDHAGNTLRFGMPENFVPPHLNSEDRPSTKQKRKQQVMVVCKQCGYALEPKQTTCPNCGTDRHPKRSEIAYLDGDLVEYGSNGVGKRVYSDEDMRDWYLAFKWYVERQGKPVDKTFAYFIGKFGEENKKRCQWVWRNLPSRMPSEEQSRFIKHLHAKWAYARNRRKRKSPKPCPNCGGTEYIKTRGAGPHAAGKRCASCNRHLGWIKRGEVELVDTK